MPYHFSYCGVVPSHILQSFGESNVLFVTELLFSDATKAMTGVAIKLFENTENLERIGNPYLDGPHLIFTLDLFAKFPGYFMVQANFFDKTGETAITHLTEEIKTEETGQISGVFKAHIVTLKQWGN